MARPKSTPETETPDTKEQTVTVKDLATALGEVIEVARPQKKTIFNRKKNTPWTPKNGEPKLKLKRKMYQHGIPVNEKFVKNEVIELMNKLRPGTYCDGWVKVTRRNDKGLNIEYPIRTAAQKLRLINQFGIRDIKELIERCIAEAENPREYAAAEDLD